MWHVLVSEATEESAPAPKDLQIATIAPIVAKSLTENKETFNRPQDEGFVNRTLGHLAGKRNINKHISKMFSVPVSSSSPSIHSV